MYCCLKVNTTNHVNCTYLLRKSQDNRCVFYFNELSNNLIEVNLEKVISQCTKSNKNTFDNINSVEHKNRIFHKFSHQIPCDGAHLNYYNITDICISRLNTCHLLIPCTFGQYLQDCKEFQCNTKFKCPNFYCIPWTYVCDGIWDCSYGYDESNLL